MRADFKLATIIRLRLSASLIEHCGKQNCRRYQTQSLLHTKVSPSIQKVVRSFRLVGSKKFFASVFSRCEMWSSVSSGHQILYSVSRADQHSRVSHERFGIALFRSRGMKRAAPCAYVALLYGRES